jgi:hypothetical protein
MKSALAIIKETIEYYVTDPLRRGVKYGPAYTYDPGLQKSVVDNDKPRVTTCMYALKNGETKYCAVGRCVQEEYEDWIAEVNGGVEDLVSEFWHEYRLTDELISSGECDDGIEEWQRDQATMAESDEYYMDALLKPEYRGHGIYFWTQLQEMHDTDENWTNPGVINESLQGHLSTLIKNHLSLDERDEFNDWLKENYHV